MWSRGQGYSVSIPYLFVCAIDCHDIALADIAAYHSWPSELPKYFKAVGFEQISRDQYPLSPELFAPFMQCHLCAAEEVSFTAMKNDGPETQGPFFRELLAEVHKECKTGVTMIESPIVVVGRKPF